MHYYDELAVYERKGFRVVVDKTWEDIHPRDCFDDGCYDIEDMCRQIDRGDLDWFMLRVRVFIDDLELAAEYLGGMMYERASDCLTDGSAEDLIEQAVYSAQQRIPTLVERLSKIMVDTIA